MVSFAAGYRYYGLSIPDPPHPSAHFDPDWIPSEMFSLSYWLDLGDAKAVARRMACWRFVYRCEAGCPDAVGDIPAFGHNPSDCPSSCPDCGGLVEIVEPVEGVD